MPDLPWTTRAGMRAGKDYLVMASHLPLARFTSTVRFFRAVQAIRKQLATADGLMGYTLRAHPLSRDYWTITSADRHPTMTSGLEHLASG